MKTTNAAAPTTKTGKAAKSSTSPAKEAKLKSINVKTAAKEAKAGKEERESIYNYPNEKMSKLEKKAFRRQARATIIKFSKSVEKLGKSGKQEDRAELKKLNADFNAWKKETLTGSHELMQ